MYYILLVENKDFYAIINNKQLFDLPVKRKQEKNVKKQKLHNWKRITEICQCIYNIKTIINSLA